MISIADLRRDYARSTLDEATVARAPMQQFEQWLQEAIAAQLPEATAMTLATAVTSTHGFVRPAARIVLLKGVDAGGFVFFTNYDSDKGRELAANPYAALLFHWIELERQVRIEGRVEKIDTAASDEYFASRPLLSRIGAWASKQSEVLPDRASLEARFAETRARFGETVPRPPHWGGYRLLPELLEFWQGRASRLHDRIRYTRSGEAWRIERLAP
jgi:pyridoxamine 5'-phosphate oxidase